MLKKLNKNIFRSKIGKYLALGSFTFFLIKGLIWLALFIFAGLNIINYG